MRRYVGITLLLCGSAFALGSKQLGYIEKNGSKLNGKSYWVEGCVVSATPEKRSFELQDGSGKLTVVSEQELPRVGDCMRLRGAVETSSSPVAQTVLRERERKLRK